MGICRLWLSKRARDVFRLILAVSIGFISLTNAAKAQSQQAQEQTMAIFEAIQAAATVAGVPALPPEAVPIVTGMVSCASSGTPVGTCATNIAISTALTQLGTSNALGDNTALVTAAASCLTSGQPAGGCIASLAASQLPDEAKPLITCIGAGGNIGDCAEKAALTVAQQQLGANLPPQAQQMVSCVVGGASVASCASVLAQSTADQALKASGAPAAVVSAVDGMVSCVAAGGSAGDCLKNVAIANIPPGSAQDFATCLNQKNANAQGCAATLASNNISDPTAKALVGCMGNTSGDTAQKCIATNASSALGTLAQQQAQQALSTAITTATTAIANLQINSPLQNPPKFPTEPAVLANLMQVAKGIQDGNWLEVVAGVGPEAAEIASKVILSVFLTPALSDLLSPVVDSMIQNDVNAFTNGVTALSKGDAVGVAEDIFKWYETQYIQAPCALMPSGDVSNAICNGLAASINWVANAGGDIAKDILGVGESILKDLGIWNFVDGVATTVWNDFTSIISDIKHFLGLGGDEQPNVVCVNFPTPASYFATNVLGACLNAAASNAASPNPVSTTANVTAQCTALYNLCSTSKAASDAVAKNCTSMANALNQAANTTAAALKTAASGFAQTAIVAFVAKTNSQYLKANATDTSVCNSDFWSMPNPAGGTNLGALAGSCAKALGGLFQLPANSCPTSTINPTYDALTQACMTAISSAPQASTNSSSGAAGPNSPLCQQALRPNPCSKQVTFGGTDVTINMPDPTVCNLFKIPPNWNLWPIKPTPVSLPGPKFLPVPKLLPRPSGTTPKPPPATASNGGHGDAFYIDGCSGNSPSANCNGANSASTKGSAMDNAAAAATGGGLAGVAGTGGGAGLGIAPRLHPTGGIPYVPPKFVPPAPKQPPSSAGVKPSTAPPPKPATATAKPPSTPANSAIDYGGCPGCGKVAPPEIVR